MYIIVKRFMLMHRKLYKENWWSCTLIRMCLLRVMIRRKTLMDVLLYPEGLF